MADQVHVPTLLARKLGISNYVAQAICAEAVLSLDDSPVAIRENKDRFWLTVEEEDWGKKLTVKAKNNTYVVQVDRPEEDDFAMEGRIT